MNLVWAYFAVRHAHHVAIHWSGILHTSKILTKDFWYYTTPALGAALVWGIAFVLYSVILGHMGSDAVAANSIASIVKSMVQCVIRGVSAGAGILSAICLAQMNWKKRKITEAGLRVSPFSSV